MTNDSQKLLSKFRVSADDLDAHPTIKEAYRDYDSKRDACGEAHKDLKEALKKLHGVLDEPLRSAGLVPESKDWTLKDDENGLLIQVWSEPRQSGRRKAEVPLKQLAPKNTEPNSALVEISALNPTSATDPPRRFFSKKPVLAA
jgi:hypothetical protein